MNMLSKLDKSIQFTDSDLILIDFIEHQPQQFTQMSVEEIAEVCFVSKSSVYRFAKKLRYDGLHELQLKVSTSLSDILSHQSADIDYSFPFKKEDSGFDVLRRVRSLYEHSVYISSNIVNVYSAERVAKLLHETPFCTLFTSTEFYHCSKIFQQKLEHSGKHVHVAKNKIASAMSAPKDSLVFYVSYLPNRKEDMEILRQLKQNRCNIVLISSLKEHKLNDFGTYNFYFASGEHEYQKISNYSTTTSLMFLFDYLYSLYFKLNYEAQVELNTQIYMKERNL